MIVISLGNVSEDAEEAHITVRGSALRAYLERGQLPALFDAEIHQGSLPPFIGVFIPHKGRGRNLEYTPYFRRSRLEAYHRFMAFELVPFIDKTFRTRADRNARPPNLAISNG